MFVSLSVICRLCPDMIVGLNKIGFVYKNTCVCQFIICRLCPDMIVGVNKIYLGYNNTCVCQFIICRLCPDMIVGLNKTDLVYNSTCVRQFAICRLFQHTALLGVSADRIIVSGSSVPTAGNRAADLPVHLPMHPTYELTIPPTHVPNPHANHPTHPYTPNPHANHPIHLSTQPTN